MDTKQDQEEVIHVGSLLSGTVTCTCGWVGSHWAHATDADYEFESHLSPKGYEAWKAAVASGHCFWGLREFLEDWEEDDAREGSEPGAESQGVV